MSLEMIVIGKRLQKLREQKGKRQKEIARRMQRDVATIRRYENGQNLTFDAINRLCLIYDTNPIHALFGRQEIVCAFIDNAKPDAKEMIIDLADALKKNKTTK